MQALLLTAFGDVTGVPPTPRSDPVTALRLAEASREREMALIRREPSFRRAADAFAQAVSRARSAGEALDNPRVRDFLLKAMGLPNLRDSPGLVKRALLSNPDDPNGLLARLNNQQLTLTARALRLDQGLGSLRSPEALDRLREGWVRTEWFERLRQRDPVSADAILFREQAANHAGNMFSVLGDPVVRRVVTTAVGLPKELAIMNVDAQARTLGARFDPNRLSDPRFVERMAQRYAVSASAANPNPMPALVGLSI